jgi:hypothetical protein
MLKMLHQGNKYDVHILMDLRNNKIKVLVSNYYISKLASTFCWVLLIEQLS